MCSACLFIRQRTYSTFVLPFSQEGTLADRIDQGFVIKGINHTGQIFLTRPSVSSCVRHGCHPLEKIPADLSDDWTVLIGHLIRLLDFSFDQAQTPPTLPPTPFLRGRAPIPHPFF
jgi:hypothetical protein